MCCCLFSPVKSQDPLGSLSNLALWDPWDKGEPLTSKITPVVFQSTNSSTLLSRLCNGWPCFSAQGECLISTILLQRHSLLPVSQSFNCLPPALVFFFLYRDIFPLLLFQESVLCSIEKQFIFSNEPKHGRQASSSCNFHSSRADSLQLQV